MNPDLKNYLKMFTGKFSYSAPFVSDQAGNEVMKIRRYKHDNGATDPVSHSLLGNEIARHLSVLATQAKEGM